MFLRPQNCKRILNNSCLKFTRTSWHMPYVLFIYILIFPVFTLLLRNYLFIVFVFADPVILISVKESDALFDETPHLKLIDTVCVLNLAAGQPKFRLICNDIDRFVLLSEDVRMNNRSGYFNGVLHVTAIVPLGGRITCAVTDDLGNYHKSMSIDINDKLFTHQSSIIKIGSVLK